jgi:hypothetical protein
MNMSHPHTNNKEITVRFSPISELRCYHAPEEDGRNGGDLSWYTSNDYERFQRQAMHDKVSYLLLKTMMKTDKIPITKCIMPFGLEKQLISRHYTEKRVRKRKLVKLAVLQEQARLNHCDSDKQERIANASMQHSEWARVQARTIGYCQAMQQLQEY